MAVALRRGKEKAFQITCSLKRKEAQTGNERGLKCSSSMEAEIFSGSQRPDEMVAHPDESIVEFGARPPACTEG